MKTWASLRSVVVGAESSVILVYFQRMDGRGTGGWNDLTWHNDKGTPGFKGNKYSFDRNCTVHLNGTTIN